MNSVRFFPYRAHPMTEFLDLITSLQRPDAYLSDDQNTRELLYTLDNDYELIMIHHDYGIFHKKPPPSSHTK